MQPTRLQTEVARGQDAEGLIGNALLNEAIEAWELEIVRTWKQSPLRDAEGRERLRLMLEAAQVFRSYIKKTAETGKLAQIQIKQQTAMDRAKRLFR